jgi:DNA-directed RNA polymerase specialized sigma24 family protein
MKVMEGLTVEEIAEKLGISPNTAKIRLFRAGIKPKYTKALYDESALETISNIQMGRPKKAKK